MHDLPGCRVARRLRVVCAARIVWLLRIGRGAFLASTVAIDAPFRKRIAQGKPSRKAERVFVFGQQASIQFGLPSGVIEIDAD